LEKVLMREAQGSCQSPEPIEHPRENSLEMKGSSVEVLKQLAMSHLPCPLNRTYFLEEKCQTIV
jgi:hypothetical protein